MREDIPPTTPGNNITIYNFKECLGVQWQHENILTMSQIKTYISPAFPALIN